MDKTLTGGRPLELLRTKTEMRIARDVGAWPKIVVRWAYAMLTGGFWEPCPICYKHFGGEEWSGAVLRERANGSGTPVCPGCEPRAAELNTINKEQWEPSGLTI